MACDIRGSTKVYLYYLWYPHQPVQCCQKWHVPRAWRCRAHRVQSTSALRTDWRVPECRGNHHPRWGSGQCRGIPRMQGMYPNQLQEWQSVCKHVKHISMTTIADKSHNSHYYLPHCFGFPQSHRSTWLTVHHSECTELACGYAPASPPPWMLRLRTVAEFKEWKMWPIKLVSPITYSIYPFNAH